VSTFLDLSRNLQTSLWRHLLKGPAEQVAFLFADVVSDGSDTAFRPRAHYLVPPADYEIQSAFHVALADHVRPRLIKQAWDTNTSIIELHSHPHGWRDAEFSPSDLGGFDEFVPHVWWRLRGRPYMAIVVSPTTVDAMVWMTDPHIPQSLDAIRIDGRPEMVPTGLTLQSLRSSEESHDGCREI
jgi:hypothetical protein